MITGRACGDRVAVISTKGIKMREIITTALHEFMHTLGIDHCIHWKCIMNSLYDDENDESSCL